ncbi:MAG TPA: DUF362 domain-containing protein [Bryobacteraceae bacterium]|nr:DUF362 domain-containing protein [Bryobacteraceae bacterium]
MTPYRGWVGSRQPGWSAQVLSFLELDVRSGARVFIKPNFTWKKHVPGITTSPDFLRELVHELTGRGATITIGESNGGKNLFTAEEAFQAHGVYDLERTYGVRVMNLSVAPRRRVRIDSRCEVEFSAPLLDEFDLVLSTPVPKVHAMTGVSLAIKNLWGCLPDPMRLRHHWNMNQILCTLVKQLPRTAAICDGTYFLNDFGPMDGTAIPRNLVIGADNLLAASLLCCRLMNVDPQQAPLLRVAMENKLGPSRWHEILLNNSLEKFLSTVNYEVKGIPLTYITKAAFRSRVLTALLYDSVPGGLLHQCLRRLRRLELFRFLIYRNTKFVE